MDGYKEEHKFDEKDAAQLLQATQRMRVAWTAFIGTMLGIAWTLSVGIWSFFLKAYLDASHPLTGQSPAPDAINYLLIAAALTSAILGLCRFYTRYLDNAIAHLYPTLIYCEQIMGVPPEYGTTRYLR